VFRRQDKILEQAVGLAGPVPPDAPGRRLRRTRPVVTFAVGDRSEKTCQRLWQRVPPADRHRRLLCYTDFWAAYGKVIPEDQHQATDKGAGQTCHIEGRGADLSHRAVEQHPAAASGPVRPSDALVE